MSTTPILQIGTSRFLQAHADLFISEALAAQEALGPITVVQTSGDPSRSHRLAALADKDGFPVRIQGIENGEAVKREIRVNSITRALSTLGDWPEITRIAVEEAEVILSNTADAGWVEQPEDASPEFQQAMSWPAKLTQLLAARFRAGKAGLTVMPTELIARNGDRLRERVLQIAAGLDDGLADWISTHVVFANSLVDRIVSEPLEPAGAVAEPYALWAIENTAGLTLPCRHPAIKLVGDLDIIEKLKLYILNLGHSYLVSKWLAAGRQGAALVREVMADTSARADLRDMYENEVLPVFEQAGHGDIARTYIAVTLDRFANPYLDHALSDIAQNHAEKLDRRLGALIAWGEDSGLQIDQPRLRQALAE